MSRECIYFGMIRGPPTTTKPDGYAFYHDRPGGGGYYGDCASLNFLAGYIDGVVESKYASIDLENGIPERLRDAFGEHHIEPLTPVLLEALVKTACLGERYPDLL